MIYRVAFGDARGLHWSTVVFETLFQDDGNVGPYNTAFPWARHEHLILLGVLWTWMVVTRTFQRHLTHTLSCSFASSPCLDNHLCHRQVVRMHSLSTRLVTTWSPPRPNTRSRSRRLRGTGLRGGQSRRHYSGERQQRTIPCRETTA